MNKTLLRPTLTALMLLHGLLVQAATPGQEDVPPVRVFAEQPRAQMFVISPDGATLAYLLNKDGSSYLSTLVLGEQTPTVLLSTDNQKYSFRSLRWAGNQRLLAGARYPDYRYGVAGYESRLIAVDANGGNLNANLLDSAFRFQRPRNVPQFQDRILGKSAAGPDSVLLALDMERAAQPDVYSLDVKTAQLTRVASNTGGIRQWMADRDGEVRLGSGWRDKEMQLFVRAPGDKTWKTLSTWVADDYAQVAARALKPVGFDADGRYLYAFADHQGRQALYRIDTADPAFTRTLVHDDPQFDLTGQLIWSDWLKQYVGISYAGQYGRRVYWNERARALQDEIDRALPEKTNTVFSSSEDGLSLLIASTAPNAPSTIYWLERKSGKMRKIIDSHPALAERQMPMPRPVSITSRDGTVLHGYLTAPWNRAATTGPTPLIVLPHGGPISRDRGQFDVYAQLLASRGWAVLQVNFRGSSGYGAEFEQAGFQRWGMEMQDDLTDSVRWSIEQGIADPHKICIIGGSYGGYAALMGIIKTPELYRCAVSLNGVADLRDLLANAQHFDGYEIGAERIIGRWWGDRERLRQTSPVNHAADIRTPLLLIHGKQDRTMPVAQSRDMADALKAAGKRDYRYLELPLGDHQLSREEDRIEAFTEMERFLHRYLDQSEPN
ncbi:prolyl oligopeptidase family serine peptidase [Herbaspirillum sp. NPDC087042]|uniref:S9 family peptidase n=1 Tax=Herbaspirillum sp. NPDC087042 TaxID=3364004 RepID=UPI00381D00AA